MKERANTEKEVRIVARLLCNNIFFMIFFFVRIASEIPTHILFISNPSPIHRTGRGLEIRKKIVTHNFLTK